MCDDPVRLAHGDASAVICLEGGRLVSLRVVGRELIASHQDPDGPHVYRGALLAPWPNRIADGRWTWEGEELQLEVNEPDTGCALHGLVATAPFRVTSRTDDAVEVTHLLEPSAGYPFRLTVAASYRLGSDGLTCSLSATNSGDRPAPVGLGVHPYVAAPDRVDELLLSLPASTMPELDEQWRETGRRSVEEAGLDFRRPRPIGDTVLDAAFTDLDRDADGGVTAAVGLPDGREVVVRGGSTCRWLVVYTGDTLPAEDFRRSVVVEPMTCNANAFVTGADLEVLPPGETLRLDWSLQLR